MSYERKIAHLEETHIMILRELGKAIDEGAADHVITDLKKKKLHVKDLLRELRNLDDAGKEFK